jgi:hypothetical protein
MRRNEWSPSPECASILAILILFVGGEDSPRLRRVYAAREASGQQRTKSTPRWARLARLAAETRKLSGNLGATIDRRRRIEAGVNPAMAPERSGGFAGRAARRATARYSIR